MDRTSGCKIMAWEEKYLYKNWDIESQMPILIYKNTDGGLVVRQGRWIYKFAQWELINIALSCIFLQEKLRFVWFW